MPGDRRTLDLFGDTALPEGFRYQPEFLSRGEERSLLQYIEQLPFREFEFHGFTGKRRIVSFGWRYDFNGGGLTRTEDMPHFLSGVRARAEAFAGTAPGGLQQVLITEYAPGAATAGTRIVRSSVTSSAFRFFLPARSACDAGSGEIS